MINDEIIEKLKQFIKNTYELKDELKIEPSLMRSIGAEGICAHISFAKSCIAVKSFSKISDRLDEFIKEKREKSTFSVLLDRMREEKRMSKSELYELAWLDRRYYSKVIGDRHYHPDKTKVIQLALGLKLDEAETTALLESAGYSLSKTSIVDLVILFCIKEQIYDIGDVNALLLSHDQKVLVGEE